MSEDKVAQRIAHTVDKLSEINSALEATIAQKTSVEMELKEQLIRANRTEFLTLDFDELLKFRASHSVDFPGLPAPATSEELRGDPAEDGPKPKQVPITS